MVRITWSERFNVYAGEEDALRACINGLADAMDHPREALWAWLSTTPEGGPLPRPLRVALCVDRAPSLFGRSARGNGAAIWLRAADPALRRQASVGRYTGDLEVEVSNPDEWRLVREGAMARHAQAGPCTVRVALRRLQPELEEEARPPPSLSGSSSSSSKTSLTERAASVLRLL
jgi:hypothetical protein